MRLPAFLFLLIALTGFYGSLYSQMPAVKSANVLYGKLGNGLNFVVMPLKGTTNTEVTFYIRSGTVYEPDSSSGVANIVKKILEAKIKNYLQSNKNNITAQNTTFYANSGTERAIFKFSTAPAHVEACMALMRDSVYEAVFSESDLSATVNLVLQQIEDEERNPKDIFAAEMLRNLYSQDHEKLEIKGNSQALQSLTIQAALKYFKKYFVPNNTIVSATGNVDLDTVQTQLDQNLGKLLQSEFNPELITKVHSFRPDAYTTQFIVEDNTNDPEFEICWQFPGTSTNASASYCAFLLSEILTDRNNFIQVKARKMGCKKFKVAYDYNNFNGILRIDIQPSKKNLFATYKFVIDELGRLDKTLLNDEMINAAKLQFKANYDIFKTTRQYPANIIKCWTYNDNSYFTVLSDSVYSLKFKTIHNFVVDFFNQSPHVTGLRISHADRVATDIDTAFTNLDENVGKYVFTYRQNITDLEGADNLTKLQNLLQWLEINPDINAQINGFSDEHEYNRTTDDTIMRFIDSLPTFVLTTRRVVKKGYLRPEMMRSLKIVKYLYDHGIAAERLAGTSMPGKSSDKKEEEDNMKCTLTLEKYHKSPSLYEYHYGKKKEEQAPAKSSEN